MTNESHHLFPTTPASGSLDEPGVSEVASPSQRAVHDARLGVDASHLSWRELLAVGVIAGDLDPAVVARFAGVHPSLAEAAIVVAIDEGVVVDGVVDPVTSAQAVMELDSTLKAQVHARLARHLMVQGPTQLIAALDHAQAAGALLPIPEQISAADRAGRMALSINDYDSARRLFEYADRIELVPEPLVRAERLRNLASALHGLGLVLEARKALARAFDLAEHCGATSLAADLAVRYSYPVDWYSGDLRASALLDRAERLDLDTWDRTALLAARAAAEMRIPVPGLGTQQLAWITRAGVAQPLSDQALDESASAPEPIRLSALLAWRTTHRAPEFLERRLEASSEALDLAQRLRMSDRQVDAALMLAVDSLESGDRAAFDRALSVASWVAERDGNPRLCWHANTVAASAALLDSDLDQAEFHRAAAARFGESIDAPGWLGADLSLQFQITLESDDDRKLSAWMVDESHPVTANPNGRISLALLHLRLGQRSDAERLIRRAIAQFDAEASILQNAAYAAEVVGQLEAEDLIESLIGLLEPWAMLFAVDSNAWWANGPVALAVAKLHNARGDTASMAAHLNVAETIARSMGDVRSLSRIDSLRGLTPAAMVSSERCSLTDREYRVLKLVVAGHSNRDIAAELAFSLSTIRAEISAIYRKLGVKSRAEATARAIGAGLV